jgi:hypothetical protein
MDGWIDGWMGSFWVVDMLMLSSGFSVEKSVSVRSKYIHTLYSVLRTAYLQMYLIMYGAGKFRDDFSLSQIAEGSRHGSPTT